MISFGLPKTAKRELLGRLVRRGDAAALAAQAAAARLQLGDNIVRRDLDLIRAAGAQLGLADPYFRCHAGVAGSTTMIGDICYDNFASYNYLGLNGHRQVSAAARDAIGQYGTTVSASRLVSGERPPHAQLEAALAHLHGTEDSLLFTSGHATNVTVIGHLVGRGDLVVHDALSHNSIIQGALLSGANRLAFAHNDPDDLDRHLTREAGQAQRVLVVIEGHYSMDGDSPELDRISRVVQRHGAWLMVDEAHSLGVLGATGLGIAQACGVDPGCVDIWMGTLSKTLAGCGGYIAADASLIRYLRYSAPGFVYSVGMSPPLAAASHAALRVMLAEPERVERLRENGKFFIGAARAAGLNTGLSQGAAIVPVLIGSSIRAAQIAQGLLEAGINVQPILYPAVPDGSARLRFFLSSLHEPDRMQAAVDATAHLIRPNCPTM